MKHFEEAAKTYESYGFIQKEMAALLAEWIPSSRRGDAIEVAAGTGLFTGLLLPWEGNLLVTDASNAMLKEGQSRFPELNWALAKAESLPVGPFECIFSASFLQWAKDPGELLRHWRARLNPGGRVITGFYIKPTLQEFYSVFPEVMSPLQWRSQEEWEEGFISAGFDLVRIHVEERRFAFASALDLLRTLHRTGTAEGGETPLPVLRRGIKAYEERFSQSSGVYSTWTFCRVEAVRHDHSLDGSPVFE